jgi:hypothetical protein
MQSPQRPLAVIERGVDLGNGRLQAAFLEFLAQKVRAKKPRSSSIFSEIDEPRAGEVRFLEMHATPTD